ncbi:LysR family transcriptional regulator [Streptomyces marincola]|uniref:LysR family transcriptional regulator n=1 Tax=Streptomyces marincola TaxID=2878388 RepID=UPI001CF5356F|nr:LysR family transcriptional regulator [Streptomyces marincola]UCM89676.1 LysR family transcriptional regulator [Streptomyces marincola]
MELRDIEIFLTLTEELHFGRTAARLHVSQARVSQAIKQQERRIGGALFDRSSRRSVQLTPLGQILRDDLRPVYAGLLTSLERARLAAQGVTATLRISMLPFNLPDLYPHWRAFRARHPQWQLQVRPASYIDPIARLRAGEMDVLVAWLPVEEPDLTVGPALFHDPRVLAVCADHELAERSTVSLETLADFPHATAPQMPDYWEDAYLPFHTPRGRPVERVNSVTAPDELINLVGTGEIVHPFPTHVTQYWAMTHIRWLAIPDMPALSYALVWQTERENDLIRALAEVVRGIGAARL